MMSIELFIIQPKVLSSFLNLLTKISDFLIHQKTPNFAMIAIIILLLVWIIAVSKKLEKRMEDGIDEIKRLIRRAGVRDVHEELKQRKSEEKAEEEIREEEPREERKKEKLKKELREELRKARKEEEPREEIEELREEEGEQIRGEEFREERREEELREEIIEEKRMGEIEKPEEEVEERKEIEMLREEIEEPREEAEIEEKIVERAEVPQEEPVESIFEEEKPEKKVIQKKPVVEVKIELNSEEMFVLAAIADEPEKMYQKEGLFNIYRMAFSKRSRDNFEAILKKLERYKFIKSDASTDYRAWVELTDEGLEYIKKERE